jgi:hypothetical protein
MNFTSGRRSKRAAPFAFVCFPRLIMAPSDTISPASCQSRDADAPPQLLDVPKLREALAGIRAESQQLPEQYLRDTVVPYGGE